MTPLRGMTVCVGYDDLLGIALWANARHLAECWVVTAPHDERTKAVASAVPGVRVFETDAFYRHRPPGWDGPIFNKAAAMNEAVEAMGRDGWFCLFDADTVMPDHLPLHLLRPGLLHGATRRILDDPKLYRGPESWQLARPQLDDPAIGFLQIFHARDPHLAGQPYWFDPTYAHAGGGDDAFRRLWPEPRRVTLPGCTCLHLGTPAVNWYGRASERLDGAEDPAAADRQRAMDALIKRYDWHWARPNLDVDALEDNGAPHRVEVPGLGITDHEVGFVTSLVTGHRPQRSPSGA